MGLISRVSSRTYSFFRKKIIGMLRLVRTQKLTSHRLFTNSALRLDSKKANEEISPGEKLIREGREAHQARVDQITASIKASGDAVPQDIKFMSKKDIRELNREAAKNYKSMPGGMTFYYVVLGSLIAFAVIWNETQKLRTARTGQRFRNFDTMQETARRELLGQTQLSEAEKESMDSFEDKILKEMQEAEKERLKMIKEETS